jgi:hypothetical protein
MILSIIVIALQWAAIAYLLHDSRRERDAHAAVLADFTKSWDGERQMLLQRIQAPEAAVLQHEQDTRPVPEDGPWQPWDDDNRDPIGAMSKEELAEAVDGSNG